MSYLRFHHVFTFLMVLAALTAFVFPPRLSQPAQAQIQKLFVPVARPVYAIGEWVYEKATPKKTHDATSPDHPRDLTDVYRENTDLRNQVAYLSVQLEHLQELNADRERLGSLRDKCTIVPVVGGDSGLMDSRTLNVGSRGGLANDQLVICPDGVIGKLMQVGLGTARVKLITDDGNRVTVSFMRVEKEDSSKSHMINVSYPDCVAIGQGKGKMLVTNRPLKELQDSVMVNDWVMLNDRDWPNITFRVGRVAVIEPQPKAEGFGQIEIESEVDLNALKEVMVVTR